MKRLYLLRHGKSSWDEPGLADHDRPLAKRGRRASKAIAEYLRDQRICPQLVLCSSSTRTRQTLERIGLANGSTVRIDDALYAASARELLGMLKGLPDDVDSVMLIGHNPGIQDLALELARSGTQISSMTRKFPTAALATLEFDRRWAQLSGESCELVSFVKPKELAKSS